VARPQHLGAGAKPTESEKGPKVNSPISSVGFYIITITVKSARKPEKHKGRAISDPASLIYELSRGSMVNQTIDPTSFHVTRLIEFRDAWLCTSGFDDHPQAAISDFSPDYFS
jgi:hypothetical protein